MRDPKRELAAYLGNDFEPHKLTGFDQAVVADYKGYGSATEFYKRSKDYLYHLTAFSTDIWKMPYYQFAREVSRPCAVLDYGCGIGADGLWLAQYGYQPSFADYQSRCVEFLRWRLERRGMEADIYDIEADEIPRFPLVVSLAVVEHIAPGDQWGFIARLAELGETVVVNLDYPRPSVYDEIQGLHYPVAVDELIAQIADTFSIKHIKGFHDGFTKVVAFETPDP